VNVRLVAASNRDLAEAVREHRFRQDLFFRLQVFPIHIPPPRDRREDIPPLVWAFTKELGR
jgi:transcriptional regulator with GAF, ATPase, and Fis domain